MFSIIRGTVGVLYYKIGTIHSALFFFFFIIEKTYVALQKVLLPCTIITLYKIYKMLYFSYSFPNETNTCSDPCFFVFSLKFDQFSQLFSFSFFNYYYYNVYSLFHLFIYLSFFLFWFYLVVNQKYLFFSHILKYYSSP